jgi:hypothetical protein
MGFATIKEWDGPIVIIAKLPPHAFDQWQDDSSHTIAEYRSSYECILGEERLVLSIRMVGSSLFDEFEIQGIPHKGNCGESGDEM